MSLLLCEKQLHCYWVVCVSSRRTPLSTTAAALVVRSNAEMKRSRSVVRGCADDAPLSVAKKELVLLVVQKSLGKEVGSWCHSSFQNSPFHRHYTLISLECLPVSVSI